MVSVDADRPTFENQFTADIAHLLHLDPTGVNIIDIEPGSVIVTCSFVGLDQEQILNALHAPNTVIAGAAVLGLHPVSDPTREQLAITRACVGSFSACSANCESTYTVAVPASGGGSECAETDGSLQSCAPGDGDCPSPEPMSGPDLSLPHQLSAALPSSGNLSQYMPDPEAPASFRVEIVTDLPDSVPIVLQVSKPA